MRALKDWITYWDSELNIFKLSHMVRLPHIVQKSHVIQISDMIRFPFIMLLSHIIRHIYWGCLTWSVFLFCFICFARLCVEFQHLGYSLSVKMVPQASLPCLRQFSCLLSTLLNKVCTSHTIVSVWNISIKVRIAPDRARTWVIQNTCQLVSHPPNTTTPPRDLLLRKHLRAEFTVTEVLLSTGWCSRLLVDLHHKKGYRNSINFFSLAIENLN